MVVLRRVKRLLRGYPATSGHWSQIDAAAAIVAGAGTLQIDAASSTRRTAGRHQLTPTAKATRTRGCPRPTNVARYCPPIVSRSINRKLTGRGDKATPPFTVSCSLCGYGDSDASSVTYCCWPRRNGERNSKLDATDIFAVCFVCVLRSTAWPIMLKPRLARESISFLAWEDKGGG